MRCSNKCALFILSLTALLSSCGVSNKQVSTSFNINAQLAKEQVIDQDERNIATRICYAYQSKSKNFRSLPYLGSQFNFKTTETDCGGTVTSKNLSAVLSYDDSNNLIFLLQFGTSEPKFMKKVQTDTSGFLVQICDKIATNQAINNTVTIGDTKVQIAFFREALDGYFIQYFSKQSNGNFRIVSADKYSIRTQTDFKNGMILGMDEVYSNQKICTNSNNKYQFSNFEQTYKPR
jgi:hypothetical protein